MAPLDKIEQKQQSILDKLIFIYGEEKSEYIYQQIEKLIKKYLNYINSESKDKKWLDERDIILITYGDQIKEQGKVPLKSLHEFVKGYFKEIISVVHILPFFPYSSDDGFSVIDYYQINPELGSWNEIEELARDFKLMFDAVINHISAQSDWFQEYLAGNPQYKNYFIEADPNENYTAVTRPRALPLLTPFTTNVGIKHIWTTFSADQIDLNFKNEKVLLNIVDLLLFYISKGASLLRLDAIGYLWKEKGTSCIHLDQTHKIIQIFREILDIVKEETLIITETNVPHKDNISYFGNGYNEAHLVYQFPLPPLTLNAFYTENSAKLLKWADTIEVLSPKTTFFNFLASHDGIGVMPAKGILADEEINNMVDKVIKHGGFVSYKDNGDGTKSPYELNINYLDALSHPNEDEELRVKRFIAAQSILLTLIGMPGIYIHSLIGSGNYLEGVKTTGRNRSINREKLSRDQLEQELNNNTSIRFKIFTQYKLLLQKRRKEKAFHPNGVQKIIYINNALFSIIRLDPEEKEEIICLTNVSNSAQQGEILLDKLVKNKNIFTDIITGNTISVLNRKLCVTLRPYQVMWIKSS